MTLDLDAIEARAKAATLGPWEMVDGPPMNVPSPASDQHFSGYVSSCNCATVYSRRTQDAPAVTAERVEIHASCHTADAAFIAHTRTDVPALVAEVKRLRAALERIRDETAADCAGDSRSCGDNADGSDPCSYCVAKAALESTP